VCSIQACTIINPRRVREGYGSRSVCVCVCVSVCLLPRHRLHTSFGSFEYGVIRFLMYCVDLPEKALFPSSGVICVQLLPSMLPGEFSMERMNISGLFLRYRVCSFSDSCYNSIDSLGYQLAYTVQSVLVHSCGYSLQHCCLACKFVTC
jgi:hypothetical protein